MPLHFDSEHRVDAWQVRRIAVVGPGIVGMPMAAMLLVPILNLFTPLFGTAFMVRMHRRIAPPPAPAAT